METRNLRKERWCCEKQQNEQICDCIYRTKGEAYNVRKVYEKLMLVAHDELNDCNIGDTVALWKHVH